MSYRLFKKILTSRRKYEDIGAIFLEASGRRYLIDASIKTITNFNVFDWCFGRGNFYLMENQHQLYLGEPKAAEVDPLDLIGQFGLFFSIPVLLLPIKRVDCIVYGSFIKCHNILDYWCIIAFLCFIGHAFLWWACVYEPFSSFVFSCFYLCIR